MNPNLSDFQFQAQRAKEEIGLAQLDRPEATSYWRSYEHLRRSQPGSPEEDYWAGRSEKSLPAAKAAGLTTKTGRTIRHRNRLEGPGVN